MPTIRLATFNCENLMMRCDFKQASVPNARRRITQISDVATADQIDSVFNVLSEDDRTLTAQALVQTNADVCALQEVENLVTLTAFDNRYISRWAGRPFGERVLFEGNDTRGIDVALLSKLPVLTHKSHAQETYASLGIKPAAGHSPSSRIFKRDCLEVDVVKDDRTLTLFVCHFKSMHGGRASSRSVRQAEALAVRKLVERRFADPDTADWVILGDLNDFFEVDGKPINDHGLGPLIDDGFAVDLAALTIKEPLERWSHHYNGQNTYSALDHILVSPRLAAQNGDAIVKYVRAGTPWRSTRHKGFRFPGVGWAAPKSSDHCPLVATIVFEGEPAA